MDKDIVCSVGYITVSNLLIHALIYISQMHVNTKDFDGDVLNILLIIMDEFYQRANEIFNPRNAMYISRNDGKFNNQVNHQKDTIINGNTLLHLGDSIYTDQDMSDRERILNKWRVA